MKGRKVDHAQSSCGIARALDIIGDWWSLLIVREAFAGKARFGEFEKSLGLAKNILSARLKKLVEAGIFDAEAKEGVASRNRYVLTPKGEQLYVVMLALWQWGDRNCFAPGENGDVMVDAEREVPIAPLELYATDGRALGPRDFKRVVRNEGTSERRR
jgi:DNA-binding HxlR family transcriptional regulator